MRTRKAIDREMHGRRGSIAPAIVAALAVAMGAIALALDRAWIDTAQVELTRATEAAALAAGRELASDDLLRPASKVADRVAAARTAAEQVAALNLVVGNPLTLTDTDVTFGKYVYNQASDMNVFLETELEPRAVAVAGRFERSRSNPIALVMRGFGGRYSADLAKITVATFDNRLLGVRAGHHLPVPALPLAILGTDPQGIQMTWQSQITTGKGADTLGIDPDTKKITSAPDGIPEISLNSAPSAATAPASSANLCLVDFSGKYDATRAVRMISHGWSKTDLEPAQSEIAATSLPTGLAANFSIGDLEYAALQAVVGECRICLLYSPAPAASPTATRPTITVTGLIAGRIMSLSRDPGGVVRIVFQPGVIVTRAARTVDEVLDSASAAQSTVVRNPYIYKLTIIQ